MYLKSLELQGFKSFADKTVISFDHDITAIVGPNGSGKSNISDAIRWVMGEMSSKELRGGKMEDVIFGGTAKRSPLGFAEATLTLDNSARAFRLDAPEVMITRRYFRSGESEYYINRQSARLRDIAELFMDTGLGKDGYSNIGQGKIDEIVSLKSNERRDIFEEAAGISKFRHRKEEAERRLADTQDNLLRIGDKISELELQVEPLKNQAEKAEKYLKYRDELKGLEITVWLENLKKLRAASRKAEEDYRSASFVLQQQHEELDRLYAESEELSRKLNEMNASADSRREALAASESELQRLDGEQALLSSKMQSNEENIQRIRAEMSDETNRSCRLEQQIEQQKQRIEQIRAAATQAREKLEKLIEQSRDAERSGSELQFKSAELRGKCALLQTTISAKKAEMAALSDSAGKADLRRGELEADLAAILARREQKQSEAEECRRTLEQASQKAQSTKNSLDGYLLLQKTKTDARTEKQKEFDDIVIRERTLRSKISIYEEMERDYEGFSKAVKSVMQEARSGGLSGVHAPLSDLISADDAHTLAIETALGGAMQDIVVDSRNAAKAGIRFLKRVGGRVTFSPLDAVQGSLLQESGLRSCAGYVGIAAELVHCDAVYLPVIRHYLGRTVVAEDLDLATEMSRKFGSRFRIVTLDGQVMNAGGTMTGGSAVKSAGVLSRKNELLKLRAELDEVSSGKARLQTELAELSRQCEQYRYKIDLAQSDLRTAEDTVLQQQGVAEQYRILLAAADEAIAANRSELDDLSKQNSDTQSRLLRLQSEIDAAAAEVAAGDAEALTLESETGENGSLIGKLNEEMTELRLMVASGDAECESIGESIRQLSVLREQMNGNNDQKLLAIANYEEENRKFAVQSRELAERMEIMRADTEAKRAALKDYLNSRTAVEEKRTLSERNAQEQNKQILEMERECARLEQKKATSEMEEKQLLDRLWESYELTPSSAEPLCIELESLTAANKQISDLRRRISALGTPNLGAIEEYQRVNERYTYLTGQRDDVEHSKRDLEEIIRAITTEMREIFSVEFAKIAESFSATFLEMFGGGKASLTLENPDDPLSCGIEIHVQPPGKQLKTITLLSGGEKAFVAIALYFAILKVRPSTFCLLDEIDAALDDTNVRRFASYLRSLSAKTQFIVITHRRGTMEASDVLYGVTMQERGVSTMLNINLNDMEKRLHMEGSIS